MRRRGWRALVAACALWVLGAKSASAAEFHVSVTGSASGDGSEANPWDLQTALDHPSAVQPGDTIWLGAGTYTGTFHSQLTGTLEMPILVRQALGARATIDGGDSDGAAILDVDGDYTWYWGFEITSSDPDRSTDITGSAPGDIGRGTGVQTESVQGVKFINLVVHDTSQGFSFWSAALDSEIYGCLVYYNGWDAPDRGHGHGIYTQNETGTKLLRDNIIFNQFSYGIHAYGSDNAYLDGFGIEGNISFDNGVLAQQNPGFTSSILAGGESGPNGHSVLTDLSIKDNVTYSSSDGIDLTGNNNVGYGAGCDTNVTITGNLFAQGTALKLVGCSAATATGNTFIGDLDGFAPGEYPGNTYLDAPPTSNQIVVRANEYEPGRAHIAILNWEKLPSVEVDLANANVAVGSELRILDSQDFYGAPVYEGTWDGNPIQLSMQNLTKAAPVGTATPPHSAPRFGAFVLLGGPGSGSGGSGGLGGTSGAGGSGTGGSYCDGCPSLGGSGGTGGTQSADDGGDDDGCGCQLAGSPNLRWWPFGMLALVALGLRRASRPVFKKPEP